MTALGIAVDNDIVFKAACYRLTSVFWPRGRGVATVGVLGAATYVVGSLLDRADLAAKDDAQADFLTFLAAAAVLEPAPDEVSLSAELELAAQRMGLAFDTGESQLAAMAVLRSLERMQTGDKRAIRALERLLDEVPSVGQLHGRVTCLEQVVAAAVETALQRVADAVCAEPTVDKALTFCFACRSPDTAQAESVRDGLASYVNDLRSDAPRVLAP